MSLRWKRLKAGKRILAEAKGRDAPADAKPVPERYVRGVGWVAAPEVSPEAFGPAFVEPELGRRS